MGEVVFLFDLFVGGDVADFIFFHKEVSCGGVGVDLGMEEGAEAG